MADPIYKIGHYYLLGSHTTYVVCVHFIYDWWDESMFISYMVDGTNPNDRFFWEAFSWQFYLLTEVLLEIGWEEVVLLEMRDLTANKPLHYICELKWDQSPQNDTIKDLFETHACSHGLNHGSVMSNKFFQWLPLCSLLAKALIVIKKNLKNSF